MGVYSFLILGLSPFGSLQAGFVAEQVGVRAAIGGGGAICLLVTAVGRLENVAASSTAW
jgi:hypothetical protein